MNHKLGWTGIFGALGVLIGAFGAHGMPDHLASMGLDAELIAKRLDQFDVGVRYHLVHVAAMLGLLAVPRLCEKSRGVAFWLMAVGIVLFSGSLYILVATNTAWLGAITPLGGLAWIIAWVVIAIRGFRPIVDARPTREASGDDVT